MCRFRCFRSEVPVQGTKHPFHSHCIVCLETAPNLILTNSLYALHTWGLILLFYFRFFFLSLYFFFFFVLSASPVKSCCCADNIFQSFLSYKPGNLWHALPFRPFLFFIITVLCLPPSLSLSLLSTNYNCCQFAVFFFFLGNFTAVSRVVLIILSY